MHVKKGERESLSKGRWPIKVGDTHSAGSAGLPNAGTLYASFPIGSHFRS